MRHRPRRCAGKSLMDQVRGGGGRGFSDQSGGGSGSLGRNCADPKRASDAIGRSMLKSWKHLVRQNSGGHPLSFAQHGTFSVRDALVIIEAQSSIGASVADMPCSLAPPCAEAKCTPENFATVAQADTIGARAIATAMSATSIARSASTTWTLRRPLSTFAQEWSMQITVWGSSRQTGVIRVPHRGGRIRSG